MKVWIVYENFGSSFFSEENQDSVICVFDSEEKAQNYCDKLSVMSSAKIDGITYWHNSYEVE